MIENLFDIKNKLSNEKSTTNLAAALKTFLRHIQEIQYYRVNNENLEPIITNSTNLAKALVTVVKKSKHFGKRDTIHYQFNQQSNQTNGNCN